MDNITQEKLAQQIGISQPLISGIFSGKKDISKSTAKKLGRFTGKPWTCFFDMSRAEVRQVLITSCKDRCSN